MTNARLRYGEGEIKLALEGAKTVRTLYEKPMAEIDDIDAAFRHSISEGVIATEPLRNLISGDDLVTIVISDMTRFWMRQDVICELLVRQLHEEMQVPFSHISVVVAVGTHRKNSEQELEKLASSYVYSRVAAVVDHDCDAGDLVYVGTTPLGTEVRINPLALGRKLIVIGATVHHIMSGYGGGRKSIVPGLAARSTIKKNHIRALDPVLPMTDEKVGSGKFSANPINIDMQDAARLIKPTFGINICVNPDSKHSALFCGDFELAWKESCRYIQSSYGLPIAYEADVVFVSCGGFPKDMNFYQSTKSLFNGVQALKRGGTVVLLAECPEGSGAGDFFDWITPLKAGCLDESLRKDFTIGGYIFYAACESIRKGTVYLLSTLAPEVTKDMGVICFNDIDELMKHVDIKDKDVYVIPNGGSLVPQLQEEYDRFAADII